MLTTKAFKLAATATITQRDPLWVKIALRTAMLFLVVTLVAPLLLCLDFTAWFIPWALRAIFCTPRPYPLDSDGDLWVNANGKIQAGPPSF